MLAGASAGEVPRFVFSRPASLLMASDGNAEACVNVSLQKVDAARVNIADRPDPTGRVDVPKKINYYQIFKLRINKK